MLCTISESPNNLIQRKYRLKLKDLRQFRPFRLWLFPVCLAQLSLAYLYPSIFSFKHFHYVLQRAFAALLLLLLFHDRRKEYSPDYCIASQNAS